jgi:hypothetical protein
MPDKFTLLKSEGKTYKVIHRRKTLDNKLPEAWVEHKKATNGKLFRRDGILYLVEEVEDAEFTDITGDLDE